VDKILSRNLTAHLIADDVGLGKTVEASMLYLAFAQRGLAERALIVTPAGLTLQWQEALEDLFGVVFDVFNLDFFDTRPEVWNRYPRVIASIDALKRNRPRGDGSTGRRDMVAEADNWDLIIFDEAHRLSAEETNRGTERTQNYQLAEILRNKARFFYLLTATPHQGKEDKFRHLLRLVEPDTFADVLAGPIDAPTLNRTMTRNRKPEVTDAGGKKLFRGHRVIPVDCPLTEAEAGLYRALVRYLELGYGTATSLDLAMQRAVGFVMVTFQKLAASSLAAIRQALQRRHLALTTRPSATEPQPDTAERDARFEGEQEERSTVLQHGSEFFQNEVAMLGNLLEQLVQVPRDSKVNRLIAEILRLDDLARQQRRAPEHILIFTEYRATQDLLVAALEEAFGKDCCTIIRGGMKLNEKRAAQRRFATDTRFLVSTEAGGEGINLHERSHILFNFDLPWNPMRIHQRIGRLDRYGQKEEVIAYNLQRSGTIEDRLRRYLDEKIGTIVTALRELEGDQAEDLREAVLGQVDEELDLNKIYTAALCSGDERLSQEEIDSAMARVQLAARRMTEIYGLLDRFDLRAFRSRRGSPQWM
jgi:SNF2 family DNA or RNA helicase